MNRILIVTHSTLAQGLYETLSFFMGKLDNVEYINAYVENNDIRTTFENKIQSYGDDNVIVLTDIPGGSVNQIAMELMPKYGYHVITGTNLSMVLELALRQDELKAEEIEKIVNNARSNVIYMNNFSIASTDNDDL